MTEEPKRRGRPPKSHLQDEHHFRTPDDAAAAGAPPAVAESGQADASDEALASDSASAVIIENKGTGYDEKTAINYISAQPPLVEAIVENPMQPLPEQSGFLEAALVPIAQPCEESPIEEKIHVMVEQQRVFLGEPQSVEISQLNGWHPFENIMEGSKPPHNGMPVRLSETPDDNCAVMAFHKRVRAFANATKRWQEHGIWCDFHTGQKITFEPKYWKERYA